MPIKISIAKSAGFCFGVKRALAIAYKTCRESRNVYMLGDIVHNENVVKDIAIAGVKKISRLKNGKDKILLIRAHGASKNTFSKALDSSYKIVDATCPMVTDIHNIAVEQEKKGFGIVIIGDKKHEEVQGIAGQLRKKAIIIDNQNNIPFNQIKRLNKACVISQSTQNIEMVKRIVETLKRYIKNIHFFDTICQTTRLKQREIRKMPLINDVMIIIGSRDSANTKRLYEISKSLNPKSYWIASAAEIKPGWFKNAACVGITAGASTPDYSTNQVVDYLKELKN
ncbi:MAG: 4-hydroxy-3-methylbut-2-enyl diphosphate reductase [Candidatus Omnitrophota bacterium]|nr:4-hydroxy-3-methylbut-2-enyl diphosphate reductase [Candidatus Omnitrophota bacterium]